MTSPLGRSAPYGHLLMACLLASGPGAAVTSAQVLPPAASPQRPVSMPAPTLQLAEARDLNPDANIVEVELTARVARVPIGSGREVEAWTYDGGLPGPLIRARVGNRLIVHFTNRLPQPTTVHWHGIRLPIQMDGVPGLSQPDVEPGGTFTYDFIVPDSGLYWYHPHVMSAAQVGFGLYGPLLIEDPAESVAAPEQVMVLSDIAVQDDGSLEPPDSGGDAGTVFGREGQVVLLNGRVTPVMTARAGALQRWRLVNAAKSRYFRLMLDGQPFTIIGVDGGVTAAPLERDELLLAPGERLDVLVTPTGSADAPLMLRAIPYDRGYGSSEYRAVEDLLTVSFTKEPALPRRDRPRLTRTIEPLSADGATRVDLELTLASVDGKSEFHVNGAPSWKAKAIGARPGETQLWTITNKVKWAHPMHLHGFFFQVVDAAGQPVAPLAWKDTVDVPVNATVRFLVKYDDRAGEWMYHCHILDHADAGLMGTVRLGLPAAAPVNHEHR